MSEPREKRIALLERLAAHLVYEAAPGRCELVDRGDRCRGAVVAVRWEHGFADFVCEKHAGSAAKRGALIVRAARHDGAETATSGTDGAPHPGFRCEQPGLWTSANNRVSVRRVGPGRDEWELFVDGILEDHVPTLAAGVSDPRSLAALGDSHSPESSTR